MQQPASAGPVIPRRPKRVLVAGATGTIGRATVAALVRQGHDVLGLVRRIPEPSKMPGSQLAGVTLRIANPADPLSLRKAFAGERFDALISCMTSRTGVPEDAWAVDHRAQLSLLEAAREEGIEQFVLLSAICVQKPLLAFQHAKLAFEQTLMASGMNYSIVRPTAFFKSLSGQIDRVRQGRPYLIFGDGRLTACKPISDRDLGEFLVGCLDDQARWNRVLPIGGPGPAITPREQGEALFAMLGRPTRFRSVPVAMLDMIAGGLRAAGHLVPALATKAELARIGHYYATESMLVLDPSTGRYDADATPSTGSDTLFDYYRAVLDGREQPERGDHAVF
jgi:divinyl chlorophyllide a 8-vinyl-reductase